MFYVLSQSDRFFLNQLIPKWESNKPFDLRGDLQYVFHREMGTRYNEAQFMQKLEVIRDFIGDHGFAKEIPGKIYCFNLLPKGNMLTMKGTIELFEQYQGKENPELGKVMAKPHRRSGVYQPEQELYVDNTPRAEPPPRPEPPRPAPPVIAKKKSNKKLQLIIVLILLALLALVYFAPHPAKP